MHLAKLLRPYVVVDVLGLGVTIAGALISARGAFNEDSEARKMAHTEGTHNHVLENALRDQSKSAKYGFLLIALGSITQMLAVMIEAIG